MSYATCEGDCRLEDIRNMRMSEHSTATKQHHTALSAPLGLPPYPESHNQHMRQEAQTISSIKNSRASVAPNLPPCITFETPGIDCRHSTFSNFVGFNMHPSPASRLIGPSLPFLHSRVKSETPTMLSHARMPSAFFSGAHSPSVRPLASSSRQSPTSPAS